MRERDHGTMASRKGQWLRQRARRRQKSQQRQGYSSLVTVVVAAAKVPVRVKVERMLTRVVTAVVVALLARHNEYAAAETKGAMYGVEAAWSASSNNRQRPPLRRPLPLSPPLCLSLTLPRQKTAAVTAATGTSSLFSLSRRQAAAAAVLATTTVTLFPTTAGSASAVLSSTVATASSSSSFETSAYGRQEYTNAITASRDTNISPAEAYDVIRQRVPSVLVPTTRQGSNSNNDNLYEYRVVDVGAGAGLSTAILWNEKGFQQHVDAVDWSATAWNEAVRQPLPPTLHFYEMDDDAFFASLQRDGKDTKKYHVIVYNFAINLDKAEAIARRHLADNADSTTGSTATATATTASAKASFPSLLLAPINDKTDYWYKQSYVVLDCRGDVVWKSDDTIGAWSVQFQPDVTATTCTGIWCGAFNGYKR